MRVVLVAEEALCNCIIDGKAQRTSVQKIQITNPKFQTNSNYRNHKFKTDMLYLVFSNWNLDIVCNLVLGAFHISPPPPPTVAQAAQKDYYDLLVP